MLPKIMDVQESEIYLDIVGVVESLMHLLSAVLASSHTKNKSTAGT
jgi:hypothetical protein